MIAREPIYAVIGSRIEKLRIERGLSQQQLGWRVDMTRAAISNMEGGRQRIMIHVLVKIAAALEVPTADLLPDTVPTVHRDTAAIAAQLEASMVAQGLAPAPAAEIAKLVAEDAPACQWQAARRRLTGDDPDDTLA